MSYNGWSNYATWRVNLEQCDDLTDEWQENLDEVDDDYEQDQDTLIYHLSRRIKAHVEEMMFLEDHGIVGSYAAAFLEQVNWREIASHQVHEYLEWRTQKHPKTPESC